MGKKNKKEQKPEILQVLIKATIIISYFVGIKLIVTQHQNYGYLLFPKFQGRDWDQSSKVEFLLTFTCYYGLYLLLCVISTIVGRVVGRKPNPVQQEDTVYIKTMNRILSNSVEWFLIFGSVLTYFTLYVATPEQRIFSFVFAELYLLGRVLFALGYAVGTQINFPALRSIGFALTMACSVSTILLSFKIDPFVIIPI